MLKAQRSFVLWDGVAGSQCLQSPGWERQGERLRTAGFKKSLLLPPVTFASVFKAALRLTPWVLCALGLHKGNTFLGRTPLSRTSVSDFSRGSSETLAREACIQSAIGPTGTSGALDLDFDVCLVLQSESFQLQAMDSSLQTRGLWNMSIFGLQGRRKHPIYAEMLFSQLANERQGYERGASYRDLGTGRMVLKIKDRRNC